ncbi:hypothetical protein DRN69_08640, partial [Candidatus Pacearchaeota archaeon]
SYTVSLCKKIKADIIRKYKYNLKKLLIVVICIILILAGILSDFQILILIGPLLILSIYCLFGKFSINEKFIFILIIMSSCIAILADTINIGGRYISLFKFYLQLWIFLALASAYIVYHFRNNFKNLFNASMWKKNKIQTLWALFVCFLIISCSIYPLIAGYIEIIKKNKSKNYLPTLDGTIYLEKNHNADYKAVKWINENIKGTPVILEAPGRSYTYTSRVSWNTGLPTVLGWEHHAENHLNIPWREIKKTRNDDIDLIYNTMDNKKALKLLKKYNVKYIYIGELEHNYKNMNIYVGNEIEKKEYNKKGLLKFLKYNKFYKPIYNQLDVQIYEVIY